MIPYTPYVRPGYSRASLYLFTPKQTLPVPHLSYNVEYTLADATNLNDRVEQNIPYQDWNVAIAKPTSNHGFTNNDHVNNAWTYFMVIDDMTSGFRLLISGYCLDDVKALTAYNWNARLQPTRLTIINPTGITDAHIVPIENTVALAANTYDNTPESVTNLAIFTEDALQHSIGMSDFIRERQQNQIVPTYVSSMTGYNERTLRCVNGLGKRGYIPGCPLGPSRMDNGGYMIRDPYICSTCSLCAIGVAQDIENEASGYAVTVRQVTQFNIYETLTLQEIYNTFPGIQLEEIYVPQTAQIDVRQSTKTTAIAENIIAYAIPPMLVQCGLVDVSFRYNSHMQDKTGDGFELYHMSTLMQRHPDEHVHMFAEFKRLMLWKLFPHLVIEKGHFDLTVTAGVGMVTMVVLRYLDFQNEQGGVEFDDKIMAAHSPINANRDTIFHNSHVVCDLTNNLFSV